MPARQGPVAALPGTRQGESPQARQARLPGRRHRRRRQRRDDRGGAEVQGGSTPMIRRVLLWFDTRRTAMSSQAGITLVETIVATAMSLVLLSGVSVLITS